MNKQDFFKNPKIKQRGTKKLSLIHLFVYLILVNPIPASPLNLKLNLRLSFKHNIKHHQLIHCNKGTYHSNTEWFKNEDRTKL